MDVNLNSLPEVKEALAFARKELHDIIQEGGGSERLDLSLITSLSGSSEEKAAEIQRRHEEINVLGRSYDQLFALSSIAQVNELGHKHLSQPAGGLPHPGDGGAARAITSKGLRQIIEQNGEYREFKRGERKDVMFRFPGLSFKTLVTLSTITPQATRRPPADMPLEERTVMDLMGESGVTGPIEYYEETTFTNNADVVPEGQPKPESAIGYTLRQEHIATIAHWIPATRQSLSDVPFLEGQIRGRLSFGVIRKEEGQILHGDGVGENIMGVLNRDIQTQAKGADPSFDAIYKGMQKVRGADGTGFDEPSAVVIHPNNWTPIKLTRTVDGLYIFGNPSDEGPDRVWGLPIRQTTEMPLGTALVGAFRTQAEVLRREEVMVELSTEHGTFRTENKVLIIAESRLGLAVYRPSAFAEITGLPAS